MLPTSMAGSMRIGCPPTVSPSDDLAHVRALEREVAAGLDALQVRAVAVGAGDVRARRDGVVEQDRDVGADRPHRARGADAPGELVLAGGAEGRAERVRELDVVDLVVAAQHDEHEPAVLHHHRVGS